MMESTPELNSKKISFIKHQLNNIYSGFESLEVLFEANKENPQEVQVIFDEFKQQLKVRIDSIKDNLSSI